MTVTEMQTALRLFHRSGKFRPLTREEFVGYLPARFRGREDQLIRAAIKFGLMTSQTHTSLRKSGMIYDLTEKGRALAGAA